MIDERTTVFTLGRTAAIFLEDSVRTVTEIACAPDPAARYPSVAALAEAFDVCHTDVKGRYRCCRLTQLSRRRYRLIMTGFGIVDIGGSPLLGP